MTALAVAVAALAAALLQLGAVPSLFLDPAGAPLLPVALVAAWAAVRDPRETWPAPLVAAVILGAASEQRVGWYLLALLPAAAVGLLAPEAAARRLALAPLAAAAGAGAYFALLLLAAGQRSALALLPAAYAGALAWTALVALALAAALWPWRRGGGGLFA
ncbi:MAG: hypothetical protein EXR65_05450 [Dehalococcoidia bacterium]|nr:hypothetical protein [Dehalococcoidia bacterium]